MPAPPPRATDGVRDRAAPRRQRIVLAASLAVTTTATIACVKVPDEVRATFAPSGQYEPTYYRRQHGAPTRPSRFLASLDAGADGGDAGWVDPDEFVPAEPAPRSSNDAFLPRVAPPPSSSPVDGGAP